MRYIIPILIESNGILIKQIPELEKLKKDDNVSFLRMLASNDIDSFFHGFAKDNIYKNDKKTDLELLNLNILAPTIKNVNENSYFLIKGEYSFNDIINENFPMQELIGYHKQKTIFNIQNNFTFQNQKIFLSYLTIRDPGDYVNGTIILNENTELTLENIILDRVSIVVKDNAVLNLKNVYFKGGEIAIILEGNGKINHYENVDFESVGYKFKMDEATKENIGSVIDFSSTENIIDTINNSIIENFTLYENLIMSGDNSLKNKTNFINAAKTEEDKKNNPIVFKIDNLTLEDEFCINKNEHIYFNGNVSLKNLSNVKCSFGIFEGKISIEESEDIHVSDTIFNAKHSMDDLIANKTEKTITVIDAKFIDKLTISNCLILEGNHLLAGDRCSVFVYDNRFVKTKSPFTFTSKALKDEEKELYENMITTLYMEGNSFEEGETLIQKESYIDKLYIKQCSFKNYIHGIELKKLKAIIDEVKFKECKVGIKLNNFSEVLVKNKTVFDYCDMGMDVGTSSLVDIVNCEFLNCIEVGLLLGEAKAKVVDTIFKANQLGINLSDELSHLTSDNVTFSQNKKPHEKAYGSTFEIVEKKVEN